MVVSLESRAERERMSAVCVEDLPRGIQLLRERLTDHTKWNAPVLNAMREGRLSRNGIRSFMLQYYHYVHRFAGWLSLVIAHAEDDRIRALLIPNLSDEVTDSASGKSHRQLLVDLLLALGISEEEIKSSRPYLETKAAEAHFWDLFSSGKTIEGLFALGPGTEGVSECFLAHMEEAVRREFSVDPAAMHYFTVHKPEVECAHADSLDRAILFYFSGLNDLERSEAWARGERAAIEAVRAHHRLFSIQVEGDCCGVR